MTPAPAQASGGQGPWASACSLLAMFLRKNTQSLVLRFPVAAPYPSIQPVMSNWDQTPLGKPREKLGAFKLSFKLCCSCFSGAILRREICAVTNVIFFFFPNLCSVALFSNLIITDKYRLLKRNSSSITLWCRLLIC